MLSTLLSVEARIFCILHFAFCILHFAFKKTTPEGVVFPYVSKPYRASWVFCTREMFRLPLRIRSSSMNSFSCFLSRMTMR